MIIHLHMDHISCHSSLHVALALTNVNLPSHWPQGLHLPNACIFVHLTSLEQNMRNMTCVVRGCDEFLKYLCVCVCVCVCVCECLCVCGVTRFRVRACRQRREFLALC